jgi:PAS domain S-box-containing protein
MDAVAGAASGAAQQHAHLRFDAVSRESEERFRTVASHAPVGIFTSEPNGDNIFVNESWCAMAGMTPEQARGNGWSQALHPEDRQRVVSD